MYSFNMNKNKDTFDILSLLEYIELNPHNISSIKDQYFALISFKHIMDDLQFKYHIEDYHEKCKGCILLAIQDNVIIACGTMTIVHSPFHNDVLIDSFVCKENEAGAFKKIVEYIVVISRQHKCKSILFKNMKIQEKHLMCVNFNHTSILKKIGFTENNTFKSMIMHL